MGQERVTCVEGKALDNIGLNQVIHRYISGVLQSDWNDPSTSAHLIMIDRNGDAKFELQSSGYCRFQFILLKKKWYICNRLSCIALNDAAYGLSEERWFDRSMLFS